MIAVWLSIISGFLAFWLLLTQAVSNFGGWGTLAKVYQAEVYPDGTRFSFRSASFLLEYSGGLTFVVGKEGLFIGMMWIFRPFHPTLFFPWNEIRLSSVKVFGYFDYVRFEFDRSPQTMTIRKRLADQLAEAAGENWPPLDEINQEEQP